MRREERTFPMFPHVRQAFGMDINQQEHCLITGLDRCDALWPSVISGEWSNNWVQEGNED
ncbi:MAG: hypothetical protein FH749_00230 [Firmicutes bacterium]|nr:hypothetical protein [Bacillota bacterium]